MLQQLVQSVYTTSSLEEVLDKKSEIWKNNGWNVPKPWRTVKVVRRMFYHITKKMRFSLQDILTELYLLGTYSIWSIQGLRFSADFSADCNGRHWDLLWVGTAIRSKIDQLTNHYRNFFKSSWKAEEVLENYFIAFGQKKFLPIFRRFLGVGWGVVRGLGWF